MAHARARRLSLQPRTRCPSTREYHNCALCERPLPHPAANGCCSHDGCSYSAWLRAAQTSLQVPSRARPADLSPLLSSLCSKPTLSNLVTINSNTYTVTVTPDTTAPLVSYPNLGWDVYEILPQVGGLGQGAQYCT